MIGLGIGWGDIGLGSGWGMGLGIGFWGSVQLHLCSFIRGPISPQWIATAKVINKSAPLLSIKNSF